jgi:hypothetical protein
MAPMAACAGCAAHFAAGLLTAPLAWGCSGSRPAGLAAVANNCGNLQRPPVLVLVRDDSVKSATSVPLYILYTLASTGREFEALKLNLPAGKLPPAALSLQRMILLSS